MPPFDPAACLAMLLAFYPEASPANLARAHRERPAYFAGGVIIGRKGDALRLPNGDVWDLIYDVDNPLTRHWQVIRPGGGGGADDPFALDAGPLEFLEPDDFPRPQFERTFETLVAERSREFDGSDGAAAIAVAVITEAASDDGLDSDIEAFVGGPARETDGQLESMWTVDPSDEIARSTELLDATYLREDDYPNPDDAPEDAPTTDPGPEPRDEEPPREKEV